MNKKNGASNVGVFISYFLIVVIIAIIIFASLIKFDVIYKDSSVFSEKDDNSYAMTCSGIEEDNGLKVVSNYTGNFVDNKLKNDVTSVTATLIDQDTGKDAFALYAMTMQFTKYSLSNLSGIETNFEQTSTTLKLESRVNYEKINKNEFTKNDGATVELDLNLDQTIEDVKKIQQEKGLTCK